MLFIYFTLLEKDIQHYKIIHFTSAHLDLIPKLFNLSVVISQMKKDMKTGLRNNNKLCHYFLELALHLAIIRNRKIFNNEYNKTKINRNVILDTNETAFDVKNY